MKKHSIQILTVLFLSFSALFFFAGCGENSKTVAQAGPVYQCSMHPAVTSNKPGDCPICGMRLTLVEHQPAEKNPQDSGLPGRSVISIDPARQQQIGVKIAEVKKIPLEMKIRTLGRVAYDPDLYNTIGEYREAVSGYLKTRNSSNTSLRERAESNMKLGELKLRLAGISSEQMGTLKNAGQNTERLIMLTPSAQNLILPPGKVWVYADLYEHESDLAAAGQKASISSSSLPGKFFNGEVKTVDLIPNAPVRTMKVRIETEDPGNLLGAGMSVDVVLRANLGDKLAVPDEAVLNTGETTLVFVAKDGGKFEPREVVTGHQASGFYEIAGGLSEGERVVVSANFLIDSESRIRSALQSFGSRENGSAKEQKPAGEHSHG